MNVSFSELKKISRYKEFSIAELGSGLWDMTRGAAGLAVEKITSPVRLITTAGKGVVSAVKHIGNKYKTNIQNNGVVRGVVGTTTKPLRVVGSAIGHTAGIIANEAGNAVKGFVNDVKQAPVKTIRNTVQKANEIQQEYNKKPLDLVSEVTYDWAKRGVQAAVKNEVKSGFNKLVDKGLNLENLGKSIKVGKEAFDKSMSRQVQANGKASVGKALSSAFKGAYHSMDKNTGGMLTQGKEKVGEFVGKITNSDAAKSLGDTASKATNKFLDSNAGKATLGKLSSLANTDAGKSIVNVANTVAPKTTQGILSKISGLIKK